MLRRRHVVLLAALFALVASIALGQWFVRPPPQPGLDGPYAFRADADPRLRVLDTVRVDGAWRLRERWRRSPLEVCADDRRVGEPGTCFAVDVRAASRPPPSDLPRNPMRLLMLSDIEGQFGRLVALLRAQGVIDSSLRWSYGRGHLVLAGDLVDRGEHVLPVLWLVYRLEAEAEQAGGRVHYLLGNHEQMLLRGDMASWPPRMRATARRAEGGSRALFARDSVLGQWLRTRPVVVRVGDHLFAHGGVSEAFLDADLGVDAANAAARPWLATRRALAPARVQPVLGRAGLTRYRGLAGAAHAREPDPVAHLRRVAARYGVRRVAIGHTIAPDIVLEHDGLLLRLDVHHGSQVPQAALYEGGMLWRVYADARAPVRLD